MDHIIVYSRERGSGTLKEFEDLAQLHVNFGNPYTKEVHGQLKIAEDVAETVNGIGFVATPYAALNHELAIFDQSTEHFGLRRELYLYYRNRDDFLRDLIDWIRSDAASDIIENEGFAPSSPRHPIYDCGLEKPLTTGLSRHEELKFEYAASSLSRKEEEKLRNLMPTLRGSNLLVIGFTDHIGGDSPPNKILSKTRAQGVADRLGPGVPAIGCGVRQRIERDQADRNAARKVEIWFP